MLGPATALVRTWCLVLAALVLAACGGEELSGSPAQADRSSCGDAARWSQARSMTGKTATLRGPVKSVRYRPDVDGEPTFLNVGVDYPQPRRLTVIIWGDDRENFDYDPVAAFEGESVCVTGEVIDYRGVSEIRVSEPGQLMLAP